MKNIILSILLISFYCNSSFAAPSGEGLTSFQEKLKKLDKISESKNFTPKQAQFFINMLGGFQDCYSSSNGSGYTCVTTDQLCLINQANGKASIRCFDEYDLDKLLNS